MTETFCGVGGGGGLWRYIQWGRFVLVPKFLSNLNRNTLLPVTVTYLSALLLFRFAVKTGAILLSS